MMHAMRGTSKAPVMLTLLSCWSPLGCSVTSLLNASVYATCVLLIYIGSFAVSAYSRS